jgi:hypothetical protein
MKKKMYFEPLTKVVSTRTVHLLVDSGKRAKFGLGGEGDPDDIPE